MKLGTIKERILGTPLVEKMPEDMKERFIKILLWISETKEVSREDVLFEQGEANTDEGILILEGMVRIITEDSRKKTIDAPDILGEVQLFTPQGARTATVEVVVGGEILSFKWRELATEARKIFSDEEMSSLKKIILDSAWTREKNLLEKIKSSQQ